MSQVASLCSGCPKVRSGDALQQAGRCTQSAAHSLPHTVCRTQSNAHSANWSNGIALRPNAVQCNAMHSSAVHSLLPVKLDTFCWLGCGTRVIAKMACME